VILKMLASATGFVVTVFISAFPQQMGAQNPVLQNISSTQSPGFDTAAAFARPVTIRLEKVSLRRAVDAVASAAGIRIGYRPQILNAWSGTITLNATKQPLHAVMERVLDGTSLRFVALSATHFAITEDDTRQRKDTTNATGEKSIVSIAGRVTDSATQKGIPNAMVEIAGIKLATKTDERGAFRFSTIPLGQHVITVRLFGYQSQTRKIDVREGGGPPISFVMTPIPTTLSGVVTTAVGVQRKIEVGNDITVLNADSILAIAPVKTVTELLTTRVPGLIATPASGIPGAPTRLRLRGTGGITGSNEPIVIVDGVRIYARNDDIGISNGMILGGPSPINQISPSSIETIEVFKGPSATALYGADAANGVIVITTKRGTTGKTSWDINADYGRSSLPGKYPRQRFVFGHDGVGNDYTPICERFDGCIVDSIVMFEALQESRLSPIGHGNSQGGNVTIRGGSGSITYSVTANAANDLGLFRLPPWERDAFQQRMGFAPPPWMRRPSRGTVWGGNSRIDMQTTTGVILSLSTLLTKSNQLQSSLQGAISALRGKYFDTTLKEQVLIPDYFTKQQSEDLTFTNAITIQYPVRSLFLLNTTAGISVRDAQSDQVTPRNYNPTDTMGHYTLTRNRVMSYTVKTGTVFRIAPRRFMPSVSIPVGLDVLNEANSSLNGNTATEGLLIGSNDPAGSLKTNQRSVSKATYGWYAIPTIELKSGLFINPGFRFDGGSATGSRVGLVALPKLSFSWIAVEPSNSMGVLTSLRPRVAFGVAGVQPTPGEHLRLVQPSVGVRPGQTTPLELLGMYSLGNTKLRPERSREFEGGFEAEFGNQRVVFTFTGYYKQRNDAIISVPLAPSIGGVAGNSLRRASINIGTVRNRGVEMSAQVRVLDAPLLSWSVDGNLSKRADKLISLAPGQSEIRLDGGVSRIVPGYPLFGLWARPITGFDDANHDGIIEPGEVRLADSAMYVGAPEPNYDMTVGTQIGLFNGRLNLATSISYQNGLTQHMVDRNGNSWKVDPATLPLVQQAALVMQNSDIGKLQTVNTLRWNSFSIGYHVPKSIAQRLGLGSMSLAVQGKNLGLKTNYRGKDPNVNSSPSGGNYVTDNGGTLPQPRVWQLRISVGN
jgi:TonB-dependent SusC/RagA subfamily outer membrane receptor